MSGRKRPHRPRSQSPARSAPAAAGAQHTSAATTPAPPPGPKTARPRKPGPAAGRPGGTPPGPVRVRVVYRPVAATVLAAGTAGAADPEEAFDALYLHSAGALRRQVAVLTGDRELAARAVRRAFDLAWQHWPEVARDSDPAGWVRAAAHTYAMAPWQRVLHRRHRKAPAKRAPRNAAPAGAQGRAQEAAQRSAFADALVRLHRERRRALLLHDGLGLSLAVTAAEAESSTTAAASRIIGARRQLAAAAPDDYDGGDAAAHVAALLAAEPDLPGGEPPPSGVRRAGERGVRRRTTGIFAAAGAIVLAVTVGMVAGPHHGTPPSHGPAPQQPAGPSAGG